MRSEIICVGTELLLGQILNTNSKFISEKLADNGVDCFFQTTVGDNELRLIEAVKIAESRADIIILTGGLGPTEDDLTKGALAKYLGIELVIHEISQQRILEFFEKRQIEMTQNNIKQAEILIDSTPFLNENGLAVGLGFEKNNTKYIILPGPPKECELMFVNYAIPYILDYQPVEEQIYSKSLRFLGISESKLAEVCSDVINSQSNPTIGTLTGKYDVLLRLTTKAKNESEAESKFLIPVEQIKNLVGEYLYCYDDEDIFEKLIISLKEKKLTIASAESFTGGGFSQKLTNISGASAVVKGSICAYHNKIKEELLGISHNVINDFGAVSEECAREMSIKISNLFKSDIGISFTGVAGPDEQEGKRVGTIYISITINNITHTYNLNLHGNREIIREKALLYACIKLLKII
jgi:nicotinamide-nucleotide amidase